MECPYCKKEMAKGKIPAGRNSVCWYPEENPVVGWISEADDGVVVLAEAGLFSAAMAESYYCKDCKIVLTPVPEKQETTMDKLKKKWNDISDKMEAASEARQARQEEERKEKQREKRGKKDPWER